jgi:hypothetical protein
VITTLAVQSFTFMSSDYPHFTGKEEINSERIQYIVTFTKVLTIYHKEFTPSNILLSPPSTPSWNSFHRFHFFHLLTWVHNISIIVALLHPFLPSSPLSNPFKAMPELRHFLQASSYLGKRIVLLAQPEHWWLGTTMLLLPNWALNIATLLHWTVA